MLVQIYYVCVSSLKCLIFSKRDFYLSPKKLCTSAFHFECLSKGAFRTLTESCRNHKFNFALASFGRDRETFTWSWTELVRSVKSLDSVFVDAKVDMAFVVAKEFGELIQIQAQDFQSTREAFFLTLWNQSGQDRYQKQTELFQKDMVCPVV